MSFNIALSGIAAAQKDLDTTANNIANVNTTGFKESRAEFADVYASSIFTAGRTKVGDGVTTTTIAQQFHQGSLQFTNNPFDMAITGSGFFITSSEQTSLDYSYTRAGAFKLNKDNYIVDSNSNYLRGFPVNTDGSSASVSLGTSQAIRIPETAGTPRATSTIDLSLNLPFGADEKDPTLFDPTNTTTFNSATSLTIYDSLGESHIMTMYFIKPIDGSYTGANQWVTYTLVDNKPVDIWNPDGTTPGAQPGIYYKDVDKDGVADDTAAPGSPDPFSARVALTSATVPNLAGAVLTFDDSGALASTNPSNMYTQALGINDPSTSAATGAGYPVNGDGAKVLGSGTNGDQRMLIRFNTAETTQFAAKFEVTDLTQDGLTVGRLTGVDIGTDGLVKATYSNGTSQPLSRVGIVRFSNEQGLRQDGNTAWKESQDSGIPIPGEGNTGTFGTINSAALEQSNVNLTTELVDLITAQRNFQANSRTLEVNSTLQQTILQIR